MLLSMGLFFMKLALDEYVAASPLQKDEADVKWKSSITSSCYAAFYFCVTSANASIMLGLALMSFSARSTIAVVEGVESTSRIEARGCWLQYSLPFIPFWGGCRAI